MFKKDGLPPGVHGIPNNSANASANALTLRDGCSDSQIDWLRDDVVWRRDTFDTQKFSEEYCR